MAAITKQLAPINDTDANFRLWGKAVSDQMLAGGWVKTADTGQIDWATVTKPAVANTIQGYEIWSSNDAAGSLVNILIKLEYGSGTASSNSLQLAVTVGFTSNGSGTLTGILSNRKAITNTSTNTGLFSSNLSAGTGWVSISIFSGNSLGTYFSVERTLSNSLQEQNEILFLFSSASFATTSQIINNVSGVYPEQSSPYAQGLVNATGAVQSNTAGFSLQFGQKGGLTNPSRNCFGTGVNILGNAQSTVQIESYGILRTYIINSVSPNFSTTGSQNIVSRFE